MSDWGLGGRTVRGIAFFCSPAARNSKLHSAVRTCTDERRIKPAGQKQEHAGRRPTVQQTATATDRSLNRERHRSNKTKPKQRIQKIFFTEFEVNFTKNKSKSPARCCLRGWKAH